MLFKKRGATPEPLTKIRARHESHKRTEKPAGAQVLCDPVMPASWTPEGNNERYQQWVQRKGAAA